MMGALERSDGRMCVTSSIKSLLALAWKATPAALASRLSRGRWRRAAHLNLLSTYLADAAFGEHRRVIVSMPPRHGKSELTSHWFPVWYLTMFPSNRIILCSYEADFAATWGRKVRDTIAEFGPTLGLALARDSTARHRWNLTNGGGMVTAGVRGPITGKGGDLVVVDDPVKNFEEAYSPTIRQRTWDWWTSTLRTRLEPGAAIVVVMTRWHEDDLVGRLLERSKQDAWEVIRMPALSEDVDDPIGRSEGDALWSDRYDAPTLEETKEDVGELVWAGLYQQRPAPSEGGMFKRIWFRFWYPAGEEPPLPVMVNLGDGVVHTCHQVPLPKKFDEHLASWDLPFKGKAQAKSKKGPDYVVGQVWSRKLADCFLVDQMRGQMEFPAQLKAFATLAERNPQAHRKLVEDAANAAALVSTLRTEVPGIVPVPAQGSKEARAAAVSATFESGNVYIPHPSLAPWVSQYIEELATFPGARYDDQVDATSQALVRLSNSAIARLRRLATM